MTAAGAPGLGLSRALKEAAARAARGDRADRVDRQRVDATAGADVVVRGLGLSNYDATWRAMQSFTDARNAASVDEIWLTEHPPVYTLGVGAPGVYVAGAAGEAKIAALGLKIKNGCSYHGLALNIDMDLTPFADIDPCGYPGLAVTQLKELGVRRSVQDVGSILAPLLASSLPARSS